MVCRSHNIALFENSIFATNIGFLRREKGIKEKHRVLLYYSLFTKMNITDMLKEGTKYLSGLQEAVLRNTDAAKKLAQITRTSLGPNGMNKMVVNHLEKLFVTNDAATIIKELDVVHPAAKMLVMASQQQEQEVCVDFKIITHSIFTFHSIDWRWDKFGSGACW